MTTSTTEGTRAATMAAVQIRDGRVVPGRVIRPAPRPGQVLVRVELAGVNWWDVMQRLGQVPTGPSAVPGVEGLGRVVEVGAGVDPTRVGEWVAWSKVGGSHAEHVVGDGDWFFPVGHLRSRVPDEQLAGLLMQGVTAQYLATDTAPLRTGDTAVVTAAAGGVGALLTQLLVARGVTVLGVVGSPRKVEAAHTAGASSVLVAGPDLVGRLKEVAAEGVAAVFDGNGGASALDAIDVLAPRGWTVLYGTAAGPLPMVDPALLGRGSTVFTRVAGRHFAGDPVSWRARAVDVLDKAVRGDLQVVVSEVQPLDEAAALLDRFEARSTTGKLLLRP